MKTILHLRSHSHGYENNDSEITYLINVIVKHILRLKWKIADRDNFCYKREERKECRRELISDTFFYVIQFKQKRKRKKKVSIK